MADFERTQYEQRFASLKKERSSWEEQWRDVAELLLPTTGRWLVENNNDGRKKFNRIIDSTATEALNVLASGMMAGATSPARPWFRLTTMDAELDESLAVKQWLDDVTMMMQLIFAKSNVYRMLPMMYEELGVFGTGAAVFLPDHQHVVHCYPLTAGEYALACDAKGQVDTLYREFRMTADQIVRHFGYEAASQQVKSAFERPSGRDQWFTVVQAIEPRPEAARNPRAKDARNMPWRSVYFEQGESQPLRESGFKRFPGLCPRWRVLGGDVYGHSPGMAALGDIKQLQHRQKQKDKALDYQVAPPLQVPTTLKGRESAFLPGGISYVDMANPNGGVRTAFEVSLDLNGVREDIMDVRQRVRAAFFTDVFLMISQRGGVQPLTAAEIAERHEEKLMIMGPVLENLHHELMEPLVDQTFVVALESNLLPPPPQELQGKELSIEFVSTLAQAQRAMSTNAIDRYTLALGTIAQMKPEVLDKFDADKWADIYSDALGINPGLIVSGEQVTLVRQQRAEQMAQQQKMEAIQKMAGTAAQLGNVPTGEQNALSDMLGAEA
ncbi:MAG: phage head-tail adapter protein [Burkholderiales bacterium]|jgi:hypothetical protein|nr:phage head-tail adapter protein [Burkholderiales bacterium]